jgi:hypothetical protein
MVGRQPAAAALRTCGARRPASQRPSGRLAGGTTAPAAHTHRPAAVSRPSQRAAAGRCRRSRDNAGRGGAAGTRWRGRWRTGIVGTGCSSNGQALHRRIAVVAVAVAPGLGRTRVRLHCEQSREERGAHRAAASTRPQRLQRPVQRLRLQRPVRIRSGGPGGSRTLRGRAGPRARRRT